MQNQTRNNIQDTLDEERSFFLRGSNLGLRIFKPRLMPEETLENYVQSESTLEENHLAALIPNLPANLGGYEYQILERLVIQKTPLLCLIGPKGSGKTTTIRYIIETLSSLQSPKPIIGQIDFDDHLYLKDVKPSELKEPLYKLLNTELAARLQVQSQTNEFDRLVSFWNEEINLYKTRRSSSPAFKRIITMLSDDYVIINDLSEVERKLVLDERTKIVNKIIEKPYLAFDYLLRLWRFVFSRDKTFSFFWLENLDRLPPYIQTEALSIISSNIIVNSPTFLIPIRTEVFSQLDPLLTDLELMIHKGPDISKLLFDRANKACQNKQVYYHEGDQLTQSEFQQFVDFTCKLSRVFYEPSLENEAVNFIRLCSAKNIRTALHLCSKIYTINPRLLSEGGFIEKRLLPALVSRGLNELDLVRQNDLENVYRVTNYSYGNFWAKPRILKFIQQNENNKAKFSDLVKFLGLFGYDNNTIFDSLNDLTRISYQLVSGTRHDFFDLEKDVSTYKDDVLFLTELGQNYISKLMYKIEYVREVALSSEAVTFQNETNFSFAEVTQAQLIDLVLLQFLRQVLEIDKVEVKRFVRVAGIEEYLNYHGPELISEPLFMELVPQIIAQISGADEKSSVSDFLVTQLTQLKNNAIDTTREQIGIKL